MSLKYATVSSDNFVVAASSQSIIPWGCICSADIVHTWLMLPSMPCFKAVAFFSPLAIINTSSASIIVAIPTVKAVVGTLDMSLSKKREFACIVLSVNVFIRVLDAHEENGSLNAI